MVWVNNIVYFIVYLGVGQSCVLKIMYRKFCCINVTPTLFGAKINVGSLRNFKYRFRPYLLRTIIYISKKSLYPCWVQFADSMHEKYWSLPSEKLSRITNFPDCRWPEDICSSCSLRTIPLYQPIWWQSQICRDQQQYRPHWTNLQF